MQKALLANCGVAKNKLDSSYRLVSVLNTIVRAVIRPVISYASVIWSSCDKEQHYRVPKLQKRAARVILYGDRKASSVALFNKLS